MDFHIVAFIDVLGFSQMVTSDAAAEVPFYLPIFKETIAEVRESFDGNAGLSVTMFSDSIIVSAPMIPVNVHKVLSACVDLQRRFLRRGILVRGGISLGKHYSDEHVTFSDALVAAYRIESTQARFPRVVVDRNLIDYFEHHPAASAQLKDETLVLLRRDRDGACFTHYLSEPDFNVLTEAVRVFLTQQRSAGETVLEKMRWLHDYHTYSAMLSELPPLVIDGFQIRIVELS